MKVTIEQIEDTIVYETHFTADQGHRLAMHESQGIDLNQAVPEALGLVSICVLILKNGFKVLGTSACVDPKEFDAQKGRDLARIDAVRQIWALEGYLMKQRMFEESFKDHINKIKGQLPPPEAAEQALINLRNAKDGAGRNVRLGPNPVNGMNPNGFKQATRDFAETVLHPGVAFINFGGTSKAAEVAAWRNLGLLAAATAAVIEEDIGVKNEQ